MTSSNLSEGDPSKHLPLDSLESDESHLSSLSMLDELGNSVASDTSADLHLRFQRLLAESALENSAAFMDCSLRSNRGTSLDDYISGTSTPCVNNSVLSNVFNSSNAQKNEEYETLFKKYFSEDFVPAEKALDKLMADEIAWKKEFGHSLPVNEKLELSCFSGIMGDGDISVRSSVVEAIKKKKKISAEEYFSLKTDNVGDLNTALGSKERPNFGKEILSPSVNRPRIAFVNETMNEGPVKLDKTKPVIPEIANVSHNSSSKTSSEEGDGNYTPINKSSSMLSVTSIEDFLSKHLLDTPGTIARSIVNTKGKVKTPGNDSTTNSQLCTPNIAGNCEENKLTDWLLVELPRSEYEAYIGSNLDIEFHIHSQSTRWLKCNIAVKKILSNKCHDSNIEKKIAAHVKFPDTTLIGPNQKTVQMINFSPTIPGQFEIYVTVSSEDAVTQINKSCITKFQVTCKVPKVEIHCNGSIADEIDFGLLPESCSQYTKLEIRNYSESKIPMTICLEEVPNNRTFFLHKNDNLDKEASLKLEKAEKSLKIRVAFKSPSIKGKGDTVEGMMHFTAYLNVNVDISGGELFLLKKVKLKGSVGVTQLLMNFTTPVELTSSGPGISSSRSLSLKNGGVVPLELKLMILDPKSWKIEPNGVVVVSDSPLKIQPGNESVFTLVFTPTWVFEKLIERKLIIHITPDGSLFEIDIHAKMGGDCKGPDQERLSSHSSQSIGSAASTTSRGGSGMPVQTTHKQLIWNTVPVGKPEKKSLRLRNDWSVPVKVLLSLQDSSHGFWLLNENGEHVLERKIKLHAKEYLPICVVFCPSKVGAAFGKIVIRESRKGDSAERFAIPLTGYAGSFNLSVKKVPKDKSGHMWMNLGPIDSNLQSHFSIYNKGNLDAFVLINFIPKGIGALLQEPSVTINPSKTIIPPGSHENISVNFLLQSDTSFISKESRDVLELGILYLTCGDEPSRQRIRRIQEKQAEIFSSNKLLDLTNLCSTFPRETCISDLNSLIDPETAVRSLYRTFLQHEIALTVENTDDRSMAMQTCISSGLANDSLIFKSILPDNTICPSNAENTLKDVSSSWSITPSNLTLLVPQFATGCITISSTYHEDQMFEVNCSDKFLSVEPPSGIVPGLGEAVAVVTCDSASVGSCLNLKSSLKVFFENDVKIVTVHIKKTPETLVQNPKLSNLSS